MGRKKNDVEEEGRTRNKGPNKWEKENGEAVLTFLVKIFCTAKVKVANRALRRPTMSKDNSVAVAIMTPPTMGIKEQ